MNGTGLACVAPIVQDVGFREMNGGDWAGSFEVPVLCDVRGVTNPGLVLAATI